MKRTMCFLAIAGSSVLGCATRQTSTAPAARPTTDYEAATESRLNTYFDCVYARADALAKGTGAAAEIAEAALSDCARDFDAYRTALAEWFAAVARVSESEARSRAAGRATDTRDNARRAVINRVLNTRGGG
jgi:hypothetical protein